VGLNVVERRAVAQIDARLKNVTLGHFDDVKSVGGGILGMHIHYGPEYRLYFMFDGGKVVVLLCGGQKGTQSHDLRQGRQLAKDWG